MHRLDLEHIIQATAGITGASEFIILGSQAVLAQTQLSADRLSTCQARLDRLISAGGK